MTHDDADDWLERFWMDANPYYFYEYGWIGGFGFFGRIVIDVYYGA
jgi:hypothetical protein